MRRNLLMTNFCPLHWSIKQNEHQWSSASCPGSVISWSEQGREGVRVLGHHPHILMFNAHVHLFLSPCLVPHSLWNAAGVLHWLKHCPHFWCSVLQRYLLTSTSISMISPVWLYLHNKIFFFNKKNKCCPPHSDWYFLNNTDVLRYSFKCQNCVLILLLVSGDVITRRHTVEMSEQYRDQLAKAIYGRLFGYLVNSANDYLQGQDDSLGYNF